MSKLTNKNRLKLIVIFSLLVFGVSLLAVNFLENQPINKTENLINEKSNLEEPTKNTLVLQSQVTPAPVLKKIAIKSPPPSPTPSPSQNPTPSETKISNEVKEHLVNVSINNFSGFSVKVPEGANHCDVLNKALSDGKLQSLNMKYNDSLKTNAVYQINGQGKEDSVWWVYKVNGTSPPLGCNLIKVNNGDSVLWEYAGPN